MSTPQWERNIWTGNDLLNVESNARVVRMGFNDGTYLYHMEYWGDYSRNFPIRGEWRKTLQAAKRDLAKLRSNGPVLQKENQ